MTEESATVPEQATQQNQASEATQEQPAFKGSVLIQVIDEDGQVKDERINPNMITTVGDEYYAKRGAAAVVPAAPADVTKMTGMKLGTGTTAAAKSGAGSSLVTYEAASNNLFDASFPVLVDLTGDTGWQIQYKVTWAAGDVTETALTEAVIVNDAATDATSTGPNTISRVVFSAINKTASDSLVITWNHTFNAA